MARGCAMCGGVRVAAAFACALLMAAAALGMVSCVPAQDDAPAADAAQDAQHGAGAGGSELEGGGANMAASVEGAERETGVSADDEGTGYRAGVVLVSFPDETPVEDVADLFERASTVEPPEDVQDALVEGSLSDGVLHAGVAGDPLVKVDVTEGFAVVQALAELQASPLVERVQPDYVYRLR